MKCIKNKKTGEIRRVADLVAWESESKGWGYVSKSEWKSVTRVDAPKTEKVATVDGKPRRDREKRNKR
jgi:hypothetical protein